MSNFHRTRPNVGIVGRLKWKLFFTSGVIFLILGNCLILPTQGFNPKDLDTVLRGGNCVGCDLSGANLYAQDMRNIVLRNSNLSSAKLKFANLKNADLSGANLAGADLSSVFLFSANLSRANLQKTVLTGSYLHQANLSGANLSQADLHIAFLFDANLSGANLNGANFEKANLSGTNLTETSLGKVILNEALYDSSTRFPNGFNPKTTSIIRSRPSSWQLQEPDRQNAQLAELHQLSLATMLVDMGGYDQRDAGGCEDLLCFDPLVNLHERLLKLTGEIFGEQSSQVASELSLLAIVYQDLKKDDKAERYYLRALDIFEKQHYLSDTAKTLSELARVYRRQGRYHEAVSLLERAWKIFESPELEAELQTKYKLIFIDLPKMKPELNGVLKVSEQDLAKMVEKEKIESLARVFEGLADVYLSEKKFAEAETFYQRSLDLQKKLLVSFTNQTLLKLAWAHHAQGHKTQAEVLYQQILKSYKESSPESSLPSQFAVEINAIQENLNRLRKSLPPVIEIE